MELGAKFATPGNLGNQVKRISIECGQQPVRGKSADGALETVDLARGQTSHARFELDKSNLNQVGIPGFDPGDESVHDPGTRRTSGTLEEENLPPVLATPHRKGGFARFLALGRAVMSTAACRPRFDGGFAPRPRGTNFHVHPRTITICCERKKAKMNSEPTEANGLAEIKDRLASYEDPKTTEDLYDFGEMLINEGVERAHWLDLKAGVLAGFSGAIVALLLSTFSNWKSALQSLPNGFGLIVFAGILCLLCASLWSLFGLGVRKFEWLDEKDIWLAKEYLDFPDQLRRYYILAMYRVSVSHDVANRKKSSCLTIAQSLLITGGSLLALALLWIIWLAVQPL